MLNILEKNRLLSLILTAVCFTLIFYISSLKFTGTGGKSSMIAVIYHFTAFSYLTLFLLISLTQGRKNSLLIILGMLIVVIYGITDELHQFLVPGRSSSINDFLIDSLGIILIGIAYNSCRKK